MRSVILLLLVFSVVLVGCTYKTEVTQDPRFNGIIAKRAYAKKRLRLYENNYQFSEGKVHYKLAAFDEGQENLTTYIPSGHPVKLSRIYRRKNMGGEWEELYGEVTLNGRVYPFCYFLGITLYPEGWRRIFDTFEVRE